jgi:imidazolonepropionase-like amidohydrolase
MLRLVLLLALAHAAETPADRPVLIRAGTLLDGRGRLVRHASILVRGTKIVAVGDVAAPPDARVYDLSSLTVTPGWIDTHAHVMWHFLNGRLAPEDEPREAAILAGAENALLTLEAGFTTVQSPGSPEDRFLRDAIGRGVLPGPRLRTSLEPLSAESGPPERLRELVRERKDQGADFIKLFASKSIREGGTQTMTDDQLRAACGEASLLGLRTLVHAHAAQAVTAASLAGCTTIEHGVYASDASFDTLVARGTYYDPNIGLVLQNYLQNKEKFLGIGNYTEEGFAFMQKGIGIALDTFRRALTHKGLKIVYGTDAVAGAHGRNYEEYIVRIRDGGMDPMDAVVSATGVSAESMGLADQIGWIGPGMEADIVGFGGDLLKEPTAAKRAIFVMKGGRVMTSGAP